MHSVLSVNFCYTDPPGVIGQSRSFLLTETAKKTAVTQPVIYW